MVISVNHLNIIDAIVHYYTCFQIDNGKTQKDFLNDEETEKGNEAKDKTEEQEKYYTDNHYLLANKFQPSNCVQFVCYSTTLKKHPYQDNDIQPPKAV